MKVIFSDRAYASVLAETTEKIKTETGGLFLGKIENDVWYIIEAIDPGPKSIFEIAYFEYDTKYTEHLINKIANLYDTELELIGLWHRHPGSFDIFSSTDDGTNSKYAFMRPQGAISGLVNIDPDFRFTMYHVSQPCKYSKITYEVGNDKIPERLLQLKTVNKFIYLLNVRLGRKDEYHTTVKLSSLMDKLIKYIKPTTDDKPDKPQPNEKEIRNRIIDEILNDIDYMSENLGIAFNIKQKDYYVAIIQESIDGLVHIIFTYDDKNKKTYFTYDHKRYDYTSGLFEGLVFKIDNAQIDEIDKSDDVQNITDNTGTESRCRTPFQILRFERRDKQND